MYKCSTNAPGDWEVYRKLRHSLDCSLRKCRSEHLKAIGDNLMTSNSKPFWKFIKSLRHSSTRVLSLNAINGTATSTIDKADALNNQFQSVFTKEDCSNLPSLKSSPTKYMLPIQISTEVIVKLWKELRLHKAPDGPDCITATILKTCAEQVAPLLQQIFQKSLDTGELPLDWQKANVSPIFKTGNRSDPAKYRSVSLTSIPCNMLEHIVLTNIMRHLEKYKVLNDEQHGFCRGWSCETQLALSVNDLAKVLDRQSQADVVIMDFSKTFDLVPHQRSLSKLCHFGITGKLHNWIQIFLTKRTQQVVLEGVSFSSMSVTSGVPQGTALGPSFFFFTNMTFRKEYPRKFVSWLMIAYYTGKLIH